MKFLCFSASSVDLLGGSYNLAWQINGDTITITMRANTNGWVGFGIPEAPARMVGGDVIIGKSRIIEPSRVTRVTSVNFLTGYLSIMKLPF